MQYVRVGVDELASEKLSPLLKLKYNNAIADAVALHDLGARLTVRRDFEESHLAGDRLLRLEIADLQHVDELVQLLGHLIDRVQRERSR